MIQLLSAITTALIVIIFTRLLSKHFSAKLAAATILCSIAFIYVGFSLKGNTIGLIVLHGVWDILHHNASLVKTDIPDYWPVYCLITDIICGVYFFIVFRTKTTK